MIDMPTSGEALAADSEPQGASRGYCVATEEQFTTGERLIDG